MLFISSCQIDRLTACPNRKGVVKHHKFNLKLWSLRRWLLVIDAKIVILEINKISVWADIWKCWTCVVFFIYIWFFYVLDLLENEYSRWHDPRTAGEAGSITRICNRHRQLCGQGEWSRVVSSSLVFEEREETKLWASGASLPIVWVFCSFNTQILEEAVDVLCWNPWNPWILEILYIHDRIGTHSSSIVPSTQAKVQLPIPVQCVPPSVLATLAVWNGLCLVALHSWLSIEF